MVNRSKAKGSKFERDLLRYFRNEGLDAERLVLTGKDDEGDLVIKRGEPLVVQAKATKRQELWRIDNAKDQAVKFALHREIDYIPDSFLVLKRRNCRIERAYVIQELGQWIDREMNQ